MPRSQTQRQFAVASPLGDDVLLFRKMAYKESLGRPFDMQLDVLSDDPAIDADKLLGQNITVRCELPNLEGQSRYFNGLVASFQHAGVEEGMSIYRLRVVPWLWFLTRSSDCRIFQEKNAPDIIKQVFRDLGFSDFRQTLSEDYRLWDYCVQYRETAFNFVSRLMEQEGIYYYFEHENGRHTLVLIDDAPAHDPFPQYEKIRFRPFDEVLKDSELIHEFAISKSVQPGSFAQTDYDFTNPKKALETRSSADRSHGLASFEMFDYPGEYVEASEGNRYASVRLNEHQSRYEIGTGLGDCRGIAVGRTFELIEHPIEAMNTEYLVTSVQIVAESDAFGSSGRPHARGDSMSTSFTVIPAKQQFRPARITPLPFVRGPQTAVVVGPDGEEIHTDEHGRVKVMFHWDRAARARETDSCWIRVAQEFAGKKWGSMQIPRVGHEVIVSFLEGDPDRPIITGRVYNGDNKPPYPPTQFGTVTTWKTNSSKGGGGFNELRFEDKKGEEQVFLHAQKNLDIRVGNDRFENIGNDRHLVVENDKFEHVKNDRNEIVEGNHTEKIEGDRDLTVEGKQSVSIDGTLSVKVKKDVAEEFDKNHSEVTKEDLFLKAKNICIEAEENLTLMVGESWIAIEKDGVKVSSTSGTVEQEAKEIRTKSTMDTTMEALNLNATGRVGVKLEGKVSLEATATKAKFAGKALAELSGGIVKIN
ncbi:MAG TPA: type VI secretion system tip protein VgrG [Phycisphaerales bacterium]|nr:type VI secretion system tip protein VgrG [Phycisphaerales bacterium]